MAVYKDENGEEFKVNHSIEMTPRGIVIDDRLIEPLPGEVLSVVFIDKLGNLKGVYDKDSNDIKITITTNSPHQLVRELVYRSGHGVNGKGSFRCALLKNMSEGWLKNAITFVNSNNLKSVYRKELQFRKEQGIEVPTQGLDYKTNLGELYKNIDILKYLTPKELEDLV